MKILVISDIHENFDNLYKVLMKIPDLGVEKIFCLGDLISGNVGKMLAHQKIPTHLIWGNNDGNRVSITKSLVKASNGSIISNVEFDTCEVDGRKIFLTHYPKIAKPIAKSGEYDAVFYGHDHLKHRQIVGKTLLLNPGEISAHKTNICSYAVYDTDSNDAQIYQIENPTLTVSNETINYIESLPKN